MPLDGAILGEGIYSPREAARILRSTPQDILRWTRGSGPNDPLWKGHYQFLGDASEISFNDLIELRVVRHLRQKGVSLQAIRFAIKLARDKFGIGHPLSSRRFMTDGSEILMDAVENDGDYVSLSKKRPTQKVFAKIVEQSLSGLEYMEDRVSRWRPTRDGYVVLDPQRAFGDPIVDAVGVSTRTLYAEVERNRDFKYVARLYEMDVTMIHDVVSWEKSLLEPLGATSDQGSI